MIDDTKEFYIEAKHWTYCDYTVRARSKEEAIELFNEGSYDDMESDYGWYDETITNITEAFTTIQLSLPGIL
tara:strand:+ start:1131 stop:1346 length:216 start_codon:yes stop_codon:yes gene_type:complete